MFATRTNWRLTPNALTLALEDLRRHGWQVNDLTESNPTRCGFNYAGQEILNALANPSAMTYEPDPRGLLRARDAIANYYGQRGVLVDPRQIFLTTSTSEAYAYVFRLLADVGDNVVTPAPSYPLFDFLARLNDVELISYPLIYDDGWQMDLHALESRLNDRTRAILLVHPNNPTGSLVRAQELDALVPICRCHSLALIADEVFADYAFSPGPVGALPSSVPTPAANSEGIISHAGVSSVLTFTLSGLSKISALPQMKLAWIVVNGPEHILGSALGRLEIIADTYLSVSAPLAHALPELLNGRQGIQLQIRKRTQENLRWLDQQLSGESVVRRLKTSGGWYAILRLPGVRNDEEWALEFLNQDAVLVHPGHFYDFPTDGHIVVSLLSTPDEFQTGVRKLLQRVEKSCIPGP